MTPYKTGLLLALCGLLLLGACRKSAEPRIEREWRVLHRSAAGFPDRTLAARKDFEPALAEQLKQALIAMDKNEEGRSVLKAAGFDRSVPTGTEDFRPRENMRR